MAFIGRDDCHLPVMVGTALGEDDIGFPGGVCLQPFGLFGGHKNEVSADPTPIGKVLATDNRHTTRLVIIGDEIRSEWAAYKCIPDWSR